LPVFDPGVRTRKEPQRRGERLHDFYSSSGRRGYDELRSLVNAWAERLPEAGQQEIVARMRGGRDSDFSAALCELLVHEVLCRLGCVVEPHPMLDGSTRRPDFLAMSAERETLAYVEVTSVNPPVSEEAQENRESAIYNAIDGARLPAGCLLGYDLIRAGEGSPPLRPLVGAVETWAQEVVSQGIAESAVRNFAAGDWDIQLELFVGGGEEVAVNSIGAVGSAARWIAPHEDLRGALARKAGRYGSLGAPYLIVVVDAKDQIAGVDHVRDAIMEAVAGDEVIAEDLDGGRGPRVARANNGFWKGRHSPRNRHVRAVLLLPDPGIWRLRNERFQPTMALNPWATYPLPERLAPFPRYAAQANKWRFLEGRSVADVLELPKIWPPRDED
jgi:hypothetical protein